MKTLIAPTESFIEVQRSTLAADVAAGSNMTLTLENNEGFADNAYVVIGEPGNETAELQQVNAAVVAGTDIQVATLVRAHKKGEPVLIYRYNQRKFYGSETAGGSYVELTGDGSPKTIGVDNPGGTLLEYTGSTYLYFKATYYNATTADETSLADANETAGDTSTRYTTLYRIRQKAGVVGNPFISDALIEEYREEAEDEINGFISQRYGIPLSYIPKIVRNIATKLAAGYLHDSEFAAESTGETWLKEAREYLMRIQKGQVELLTDEGSVISERASNSVGGFPDSSIDSNTSEKPKFTIDQKF